METTAIFLGRISQSKETLLVCYTLGLVKRTAYTTPNHGSRHDNPPANDARRLRNNTDQRLDPKTASRPDICCRTSITNGRLIHSAPDTQNQSQRCYSTSITNTDCYYGYSDLPPHNIPRPGNALRASRHERRSTKKSLPPCKHNKSSER